MEVVIEVSPLPFLTGFRSTPRRPHLLKSDQVDRDVDVPAGGLGVRAQLVCGVYQGLSDLGLQTRQADVEASPEDVTAVIRAEVHLGVDGPVGREGNFPLSSGQPD